MGWFDEGSDSSRHGHKHKSSRSRRQSNVGSIFSLGNPSRSSFFGGRSSSYYKRSPRSGFVQRTIRKLRRLLRDLFEHIKKNPVKVFFLVIMPLITGGALTQLLRQVGIRLPNGVEKMFQGMSGGTSVGRGPGGGMQFERQRRTYEGSGIDMGDVGSGMGSLLNVAKLFI